MGVTGAAGGLTFLVIFIPFEQVSANATHRDLAEEA
jgi:hypothetical protein